MICSQMIFSVTMEYDAILQFVTLLLWRGLTLVAVVLIRYPQSRATRDVKQEDSNAAQ